MTPEQEALARRAVACPQWRWLPGMLSATPTGAVWRELGADRLRVQSEWEAGGPCGAPNGAVPDLTDPATLGCILALVREVHGPATVVRLVGVNGRGGQEWAISDRAPAVDGWHLAAPALGYWESEVEALVAALVAALGNGGGGK